MNIEVLKGDFKVRWLMMAGQLQYLLTGWFQHVSKYSKQTCSAITLDGRKRGYDIMIYYDNYIYICILYYDIPQQWWCKIQSQLSGFFFWHFLTQICTGSPGGSPGGSPQGNCSGVLGAQPGGDEALDGVTMEDRRTGLWSIVDVYGAKWVPPSPWCFWDVLILKLYEPTQKPRHY
jgi:hypothetical protein